MKHARECWSTFLLAASMVILAFDYGIFTVGKGSISLGILSVGDIELRKLDFVVLVMAGLILISLWVHVATYFKQYILLYKEGYLNNPRLCDALRSFLAKTVGHDKVGSPTGNLNPGLRKRPVPLGVYIKLGGNQTPRLEYEIPDTIHVHCVLSGIGNATFSRSFVVLTLGGAIGMLAVWKALV